MISKHIKSWINRQLAMPNVGIWYTLMTWDKATAKYLMWYYSIKGIPFYRSIGKRSLRVFRKDRYDNHR